MGNKDKPLTLPNSCIEEIEPLTKEDIDHSRKNLVGFSHSKDVNTPMDLLREAVKKVGIKELKTIMELFEEGHRKVRTDPWNEYAYLYLGEKEDKCLKPVIELYDIKQYFENERPVEVLLFTIGYKSKIWEPWIDPKDKK